MKIYRHSFILLICFIFLSLPLKAQQHLADSLQKILASNPSDSVKASILTDLVDFFCFTDSLKASEYNNQMIETAKRSGPAIWKGNTLGDVGYNFHLFNQYPEAIQYYQEGIGIFEELGDEYGKAKILLNLGRLYSDLGVFDSSLNLYIQAEDIFIRHKKNDKLLNCYTNIKHVYGKLYQPLKVEEYSMKIRDLLPQITTPRFLCGGLNAYGSYLAQKNQFDSAFFYLKRAKSIAVQHNMPDMLYKVIYNMAYTAFQKKDYLLEHTYNLELLSQVNSMSGSDLMYCEVYYKLGTSYSHIKKYQESEKYLKEAMHYALKINSKIWQRDVIEIQAVLKSKQGRYEEAYQMLQTYIDINNEVFSEETREQTNLLNARFDVNRKELEIKRLAAENELQIEKVRKRNIFIFSLIAGITLLLLLAYFIIRNFRQQHLIQKQRLEIKDRQIHELEKEKQLVALHATLQGEEAERSRLARDLHDGLGGLLSGIRLKFHSMKGNAIITREGIEQYDHALGLLDSSIKELRQVAHNLMPETLIKFGLKSALEDFCDSVSSKACIVKFSFFGSANRADENLEIASYRIVQELVNNSFKHASASEIIVQMIQEDNRIHLTVQDNGTGFDTNLLEKSTGKGLANIRSRVASFQGSMDIHSTPGVGTETSIEFLL